MILIDNGFEQMICIERPMRLRKALTCYPANIIDSGRKSKLPGANLELADEPQRTTRQLTSVRLSSLRDTLPIDEAFTLE